MPTSDPGQARSTPGAEGWAKTAERLAAAHREGTLGPEELERLATAAYLTGRDDTSTDAWSRAHKAHLEVGDDRRAARAAFWLAFQLLMGGEHARGGGWLARARRLLEARPDDGVEEGLLAVPAGLRALSEGRTEAALEAFTRAARTGERFDEPDLVALGRLGRGQALVRLGATGEGVGLLDEAMAAAEAGALSPVVVGVVYCAVIETCHEIFDLPRAAEWTEALSRWCAAHPDLVAFRGQCLVRRAEILEIWGDWPDALEEARRAYELLADPRGEPAAGSACYRRGELLRLTGRRDEAEEAYREASRWGRDAQPGLALLRLAEGDVEAAVAALRRAEAGAEERAERCRLLPALVEVLLAAGDVDGAREAAGELAAHAADLDTALLRALAARAAGAVRLAEGDDEAALGELAAARRAWSSLEAPYEAARTRVLVARACRGLGDEETAAMELEEAARTFRDLGAGPDLERVGALRGESSSGDRHGLTPREVEVLRHVAGGGTNREIGAALSISERTVERHLTNLYRKLHVSSRAAATAWAYEHDVV